MLHTAVLLICRRGSWPRLTAAAAFLTHLRTRGRRALCAAKPLARRLVLALQLLLSSSPLLPPLLLLLLLLDMLRCCCCCWAAVGAAAWPADSSRYAMFQNRWRKSRQIAIGSCICSMCWLHTKLCVGHHRRPGAHTIARQGTSGQPRQRPCCTIIAPEQYNALVLRM
jgi:hypothetical protein